MLLVPDEVTMMFAASKLPFSILYRLAATFTAWVFKVQGLEIEGFSSFWWRWRGCRAAAFGTTGS